MMKKINDIIGDAKTIRIAGHVRPDGDSKGSCITINNNQKKTINAFVPQNSAHFLSGPARSPRRFHCGKACANWISDKP